MVAVAFDHAGVDRRAADGSRHPDARARARRRIDLAPGGAGVRGLVDSLAGDGGEERLVLRVAGIERDQVGSLARVQAARSNQLEAVAAVDALPHAAALAFFRLESGDQQHRVRHVRSRVRDARHLLAGELLVALELPGDAAVGGDGADQQTDRLAARAGAVAEAAGAGVEDARIARLEREHADGERFLLVAHRFPVRVRGLQVGRAPHATVHRADVGDIRIRRIDDDGVNRAHGRVTHHRIDAVRAELLPQRHARETDRRVADPGRCNQHRRAVDDAEVAVEEHRALEDHLTANLVSGVDGQVGEASTAHRAHHADHAVGRAHQQVVRRGVAVARDAAGDDDVAAGRNEPLGSGDHETGVDDDVAGLDLDVVIDAVVRRLDGGHRAGDP